MATTDHENAGTVALNNYLQNKGRLTSLVWKDEQGGPRHAVVWTSRCMIDGEELGKGTGNKLNVARDAAANVALAALIAMDEASEGDASASNSEPATAT
ncbi:hypothetical protein C8Q70DRAFT_1053097 [Cubamyces menziesii]|uniref:DRBM domain-containing protein n=1 Tax=Trametes cubensis TaxID=1111947 RepID=A0AAD7X8B9_9APHY|nr:hypothetical protein C8Q70DRAFT_1053097 [Cubamyces menziesii]KAJ8480706.1 hypothetical protein ONZ51_g6480 [Trametes cubensis]